MRPRRIANCGSELLVLVSGKYGEGDEAEILGAPTACNMNIFKIGEGGEKPKSKG